MRNTSIWWKQFANSKEDLAIEIKELLDNDWSMPKIAKKYGVSSTAIHNLIKKYQLGGRRQNLRSKEWLYNEYIVNKRSMNEIAIKLSVTPQAIASYIEKFKIEKRNISEIQKIATSRYRSTSGDHLPIEAKSLGYMIRFDGVWFASAAEFTYFLVLKSKNISFEFQKCVFQKRPDFIVNGKMIIEIKHGDLNSKQLASYSEYANKVKNKLGLSYKIIYTNKSFVKEHKKICKFLKEKGGKRNENVVLLTKEDENFLISMVS
jgi:predicted DNA-binding protein YlxM (UPF0122 family)